MIDKEIKNWAIKAMEDFNIAKHELTFPENEISTGPVCFHRQQVVEEMLKAYLVSKKVDFGKAHDLETLLKLCSEQDSEFKNLTIGNLTDYAVEVRYPEEFYIPSVDEAKECFELALKAKDFVLKKVELKENKVK
ncbi:MAG: HEPN domain-containing protein [Bacteroidota bacterium]